MFLAGIGADFVDALGGTKIYAQDDGGVNDIAAIWDRNGKLLHRQGQIDDDYVRWRKDIDIRVYKGETITHYSRFGKLASHRVTVLFLDDNKEEYGSRTFKGHRESYTFPKDGYIRFPKGIVAREYSRLLLYFKDCGSWSDWQDQGCGQGSCSSGQMSQTRTRDCGDFNTEQETRCIEKSECSSLNVSCSASPSSTNTNQAVTFSASASGGTGFFNYLWSGGCSGSGSSCQRYFSSPGNHAATVSVTSGGQTQSASCSVFVEEGCVSHDQRACYNGDVFWYDSCGNREEKYDDCGYNETCQNGACVRNNDFHVSCDAYPDPAETGEQVTFSASASGGDGYSYSYSWSGDCYDRYSSSCQKRFYYPGTYSATVTVESGGDRETATCRVRVGEEEEKEKRLACYNDDVYWFDEYGDRLERYENCGSDYCENDGGNYCYNGNVYQKKTCYEKGCSSGACYTHSYADRELVERCDSNETCSNGRCVSECECSSGPCCDGCHYKPSDTVCNIETQTQYGCPWGTGCGADAGKRTRNKFQYCSGESSQCDGNWSSWSDWASWQVSDYCSYNETCSPGSQACQYNSACVTSQQSYYQNHTKACYDNDLYWYDSNGLRQGKYRDCSDNNECTLDRCENGACLNETKCDGSVCSIGSEDYCEYCDHCGDGACNCGEDNHACPEDCLGLIFSILAKSQKAENKWEEFIEVRPEEEIHFLMNVTNTGPEDLDQVIVEVDLPSEISSVNELTIEGKPLSGNIEKGISLGFLPANTTRTISFQGKASSKIDTSQELEVVGEAKINGSSASDYVRVDILATGRPSAAAGLIFSSDLFKKWYFWLLILPFALAILFLISKKILSFSKS